MSLVVNSRLESMVYLPALSLLHSIANAPHFLFYWSACIDAYYNVIIYALCFIVCKFILYEWTINSYTTLYRNYTYAIPLYALGFILGVKTLSQNYNKIGRSICLYE